MTRLPPHSIRLYTSTTTSGQDLYPAVVNERVARTQTAVWEVRVVTGPVSADAETLLSSWTQDDYSGGFGIKDANETTDTARIAFGVIDGRRPKSMALPPETTSPTKPNWATGDAWPLGDIGTQFYVGWESGIAGWDRANQAFYTTQNAWPTDFVPVNEAVSYAGTLFVPGGSEGLALLTETTAATGTLTVTQVAGIPAVALGRWDSKLWAIDTSNRLWMLTPTGAAAGASNTSNWGSPTGTGTYTGTPVQDGFQNDFKLDSGLTPTALLTWYNAAQEETLWCVTRAQGAYQFNPDEPRWIKSTIREGAHPDWGRAAEVFRDGEDLFIAGGGLDLTRFTTANVEVPLSGPSKDQGVPAAYQGTIVDLCSERSTLYALVKTDVYTWAVEQTVGSNGTGNGQFDNPTGVAWSRFNDRLYVGDSVNNRVEYFTSAGVYAGKWSLAVGPGTGSCYLAVDDTSGRVYVSEGVDASPVACYSSTGGSVIFRMGASSSVQTYGIAVNQTNQNVYFAQRVGATDTIQQYTSSGTLVRSWAVGTDPVGVAINPLGGATADVYVACSGDDTIEQYTYDGTLIRTFGATGTGDGQLDTPTGLAVSRLTGHVFVVDSGNNRVMEFSGDGTYLDQFAQTGATGIALDPDEQAWVTITGDSVKEWQRTLASDQTTAAPAWLGAWTGTAWCALWETRGDIVPTWMRVALTGDYALWWADGDGTVYRQLLPPPFFNPASRVLNGVYPFAATGWMETVRYDANMSGWDKIASHAFAQLDYASDTTYVDISYRTDADQFSTGLADPPYRPWKRVDHAGRTLCWFDDTTTDAISGDPWREGEAFQWVQFRFDFTRGDDRYKSPIWLWHSLHHLAVPQDSASFVIKVPIAKAAAKPYGRAPQEMAQTLRDLQTTRGYVHLQIGDPDPDHDEWQVFFRGKVTQVKSEFVPGPDGASDEVVVFNFVEIGASSNRYTTVASNTP